MDLSIIIPHRGSPLGLWATVQSCEMDLKGSGLSYEYVIISNGEEKPDIDLLPIVEQLNNNKTLGYFEHFEDALWPPSSRNLGASKAVGRILFFFDNHCLVCPDYFKRSVLDIDYYGMDLLHSTTRFYEGGPENYHYILKLSRNFWGEASSLPYRNIRPYKMAMGGHGGFAIKKAVWDGVGGYWEGLVGYGGEEPYFDLKMALMDKSVWIDPKVIHYHYAGRRGYARHYCDDFYRNMMMAAHIIGGESWLYKVYDSFNKNYIKMVSENTMYDLMTQAFYKSLPEKKELDAVRFRSLDEQLEYFRLNDVAYN